MTDEHRLALRLGQEIDNHQQALAVIQQLCDRFDYVLTNCVGEAYWPLVGQKTIDMIVYARRLARDHSVTPN